MAQAVFWADNHSVPHIIMNKYLHLSRGISILRQLHTGNVPIYLFADLPRPQRPQILPVNRGQ
jgi:hypothetical protein